MRSSTSCAGVRSRRGCVADVGIWEITSQIGAHCLRRGGRTQDFLPGGSCVAASGSPRRPTQIAILVVGRLEVTWTPRTSSRQAWRVVLMVVEMGFRLKANEILN